MLHFTQGAGETLKLWRSDHGDFDTAGEYHCAKKQIKPSNVKTSRRAVKPSGPGTGGGNTPRDTKTLTGDGSNAAFTTDNRANIHDLDAAWPIGDDASSVCHSLPRCP